MITYTATNTRDGRFYIGSTTNLEKRKQEHLKRKINYPFQRALRKHPEDFVWHFTEDGLSERRFEQVLLNLYFGTKLCYNLTPRADCPPGMAGRPVSEETRRKQSLVRTGLKRSKETRKKMSESGKVKVFSKEHRRKLSEANKGRTHSEKSKQKMKEALKGRPAHNKGNPASEETKRKMSEANKGKPAHNKGTKWWNNGVEEKMCVECPGEGWINKRLNRKLSKT